MSQQNRTTLKGYFNTGDTPTEAQFADLIDSFPLVSETALIPVNNQTGTTYTILSSDAGKQLIFTNGSPITITVPAGLPIGFNCVIYQAGVGEIELDTSAITLAGYANTTTDYPIITLVCRATNNFYSTGGTLGLTQLTAPSPVTTASVTDTTLTINWNNVSNETGFLVEISDDAGATWTTLTTTAPNVTTHPVTGLSPSTLYSVGVTSVGDGVTYSNSTRATTTVTTDATAVVPVTLTMTGSPVNIVPYTDGFANGAADSGLFDGYAFDVKYLAAGNNGWVQCKYDSSLQENGILAFNLSNASESYIGNYEAGFLITVIGQIFDIENGVLGSNRGSSVVGNYYRLERTGSTIKIRTSASEFTGFTDLYTFPTFTSSANLYINMALRGGKTMIFLKGYNLT